MSCGGKNSWRQITSLLVTVNTVYCYWHADCCVSCNFEPAALFWQSLSFSKHFKLHHIVFRDVNCKPLSPITPWHIFGKNATFFLSKRPVSHVKKFGSVTDRLSCCGAFWSSGEIASGGHLSPINEFASWKFCFQHKSEESENVSLVNFHAKFYGNMLRETYKILHELQKKPEST